MRGGTRALGIIDLSCWEAFEVAGALSCGHVTSGCACDLVVARMLGFDSHGVWYQVLLVVSVDDERDLPNLHALDVQGQCYVHLECCQGRRPR
jgi:hypothetical protein